MTTLRNNYRMVLPNLTMRSIYMNYYNEMNHMRNAQRYVPTYERFTERASFRAAGTKLLRAIPRAVPGTGVRQDQREFHPLLLLRALFPLPEQLLYVRHRAEIRRAVRISKMTGIPGTDYYKDDRLVEFKYFKAEGG